MIGHLALQGPRPYFLYKGVNAIRLFVLTAHVLGSASPRLPHRAMLAAWPPWKAATLVSSMFTQSTRLPGETIDLEEGAYQRHTAFAWGAMHHAKG